MAEPIQTTSNEVATASGRFRWHRLIWVFWALAGLVDVVLASFDEWGMTWNRWTDIVAFAPYCVSPTNPGALWIGPDEPVLGSIADMQRAHLWAGVYATFLLAISTWSLFFKKRGVSFVLALVFFFSTAAGFFRFLDWLEELD